MLSHKQQKLAVQLSINVLPPRLSGATITVKNTNRSTTVGDDGKFSIEASKGDVLIITMVGFQKTQVVVVKAVQLKLSLQKMLYNWMTW